MYNKLLDKLPTALFHDEILIDVAAATLGNSTGAIALTDKRLVYVASLLGVEKVSDMNLYEITSVENTSNLIGGVVVKGPGVGAEYKDMNKKDAQRLANACRIQIAGAKRAQEPIIKNTQPSDNNVDVLMKYVELHEKGHITAEELTEKKKELLD
ncbi:MAG: hypothetical protein QM571_04485 [Micrococcaceae bacterium]